MDLSNLFVPDQPLYVKDIAHKAKVRVDERGTEAAAATVAEIMGGSPLEVEPPVIFHANHPFVYSIYDKKTRFIHYMGLLTHPKLE
jgi:serpin B